MNCAIVGATGLIGGVMLKVLEERNFPVEGIIPVASERSIGKKVIFRGKSYPVVTAEEAVAFKPQLALFSAGADASRTWAPHFAAAGCTVIDNSSAWRREPQIPLVVPEVNAAILKPLHKIIANPNCSTIPLVMILHPLQLKFGIKRVIVSTYQSVTGTGQKGIKQLSQERQGLEAERVYPHPIDLNVIPQGGVFTNSGYTVEEVKLMDESRKILGLPHLNITCTVVRVPVYGGHSESVNIELETDFQTEDVRSLWSAFPGVEVLDQPAASVYPTPLNAEGKDQVFVGRLRRDDSVAFGLNTWISTDNTRKGAATNAVQIAEYLLDKGML